MLHSSQACFRFEEQSLPLFYWLFLLPRRSSASRPNLYPRHAVLCMHLAMVYCNRHCRARAKQVFNILLRGVKQPCPCSQNKRTDSDI
ncbi:uncharacterized protein EV420DRAFT_1064399 [Desarmillaria tabescens]|uniref:Uncharacterized protein n=1 Tax=Armillaria tabescens TaxID=1929756 RepID=A0AA39JHW5_ARMTA|nr:uncharacterized protein EV420DRAFT_1064399 [Desarmillaria tabescens]KAK0443061.1 hypothetical protein EV420DRAFT_1064399 [Desarmillaria tabescens]